MVQLIFHHAPSTFFGPSCHHQTCLTKSPDHKNINSGTWNWRQQRFLRISASSSKPVHWNKPFFTKWIIKIYGKEPFSHRRCMMGKNSPHSILLLVSHWQVALLGNCIPKADMEACLWAKLNGQRTVYWQGSSAATDEMKRRRLLTEVDL